MTDTALQGRDASKLGVLLQGRGHPTTARRTDRLEAALERMFDNDYSQLPIIDESDRPIGLLTQRDILRAIGHLDTSLSTLTVRDVMGHSRPEYVATLDTTVWSVLERFGRISALMVVDDEVTRRLVGIITPYDTTTYLRQRSEDAVNIQDIEETIRHLIKDAWRRDDPAGLDGAIADMTREQWQQGIRGHAWSAIELYAGEALDKRRCGEIVAKLLERGTPTTPPFDRLTFAQYRRLFVSGASWARYQPRIGADHKRFNALLGELNDARNDLAHNRPIDRRMRDRLAWFKEWLDRTLYPLLDEPFGEDADSASRLEPSMPPIEVATGDHSAAPHHAPPPEPETVEIDGDALDDDEPGEPADEEVEAAQDEGPPDDIAPLAPLTALLRRRRSRKIELTFDDIEAALDRPLPPEAREHRSWWSNGADHAEAWLATGYSITGAFMGTGRVRFVRDRERATRYLDFFVRLAHGLEAADHEPFEPKSNSWNRLGWAHTSRDEGLALIAAFTKARHFQLSVMIDAGDGSRNEQIFDGLYAREAEIARRLGGELVWLRRDNRRACIVAWRAPGENHISDAPDQQAELLAWAIETTPHFMTTMRHVLAEF